MSASPCIGAGADAANNGGLDFRGKVLMSPPDIGAYEFDATVEHICDMCPVCAYVPAKAAAAMNPMHPVLCAGSA